jgi:DNA-directed RNA polymerase specialized sigma24 family protein
MDTPTLRGHPVTTEPAPTGAQKHALTKVTKASEAYEVAADRAKAAKAKRDSAIYDARHYHGASYADLAVASGVTRDRVNQLLKEARAARA